MLSGTYTVEELQRSGILLVEDGNHGEYRPRAEEFVRSGTSLVRATDITAGRISFGETQKIDNVATARIRKGIGADLDVIISHKGTVGKVAFVPVGSPAFVCSPQTTFWRSLDHSILEPRYIYYYLKSPSFVSQLRARENETDMAAYVSLTQQRQLLVELPQVQDQRSIVELLGALDDKIAHNERIRETALNLASACYEAAGTSSEPELIGDFADLFDGPHATPQKTQTGPWFLSISSLKSGYLDLSESAHLSEEDFPRWTRRVQPQAEDVLFSYETRLGDAALMPSGIRSSLGRRMALLRSKSSAISGSLLLHAYLSPAFQEEIKRRTVHGATVDRLPLKEMPGWRISLPAPGERERLSAKLDVLHASVTHTAKENRTLADLRDTLLPQLLSGKLRVRDAVSTVEEVV
ncbi:restriction endonuclease subunit S [Streptomyces sp. FXJ1.172]|uniref:restriction endonuclease subunit S n=1 Tax=Streptomyces sp. FXJ1.172 TaxID=710705 RepID=UPI00099FA27B|nr:restriction endonuclease subunit S [Streptomyces sp. FXJ1.172]WEO94643.1 restriction endonuclease subunit S [Streptomyces sp. FXJ1.172]